MKHLEASHPERDAAALYALDALAGDEAEAMRAHLAEGCAVCRDEVAGLRAVAGELSLAAPPSRPSDSVRERVLRESAPRGFTFVLAGEGAWERVSPGVERRLLGSGSESSSYLVRLAPGAVANTHGHDVVEHCLVLSGDVRLGGRDLGAGDFHLAPPGTVHEDIVSRDGCVLLVVEAR